MELFGESLGTNALMKMSLNSGYKRIGNLSAIIQDFITDGQQGQFDRNFDESIPFAELEDVPRK